MVYYLKKGEQDDGGSEMRATDGMYDVVTSKGDRQHT
jgi:hypothetical protein